MFMSSKNPLSQANATQGIFYLQLRAFYNLALMAFVSAS